MSGLEKKKRKRGGKDSERTILSTKEKMRTEKKREKA